MVIRLAYEQGVLTKPSLNWWQKWALTYMMSWKRWEDEAKEESFIKHQLAVNDWDRYVQLFGSPDLMVGDDGEEEVPVGPDDFREIDAWLRKASQMRAVSAGDLPVQGPEDGWV